MKMNALDFSVLRSFRVAGLASPAPYIPLEADLPRFRLRRGSLPIWDRIGLTRQASGVTFGLS